MPSRSAGDASTAPNVNPSPLDTVRCLPDSDDAPIHLSLVGNEKLATGGVPLMWSGEAMGPATPEPVVASAHVDSLDSGFASA